jgi:hypothetical protein
LRKEDERVKNSRFSEEQIIGILKQGIGDREPRNCPIVCASILSVKGAANLHKLVFLKSRKSFWLIDFTFQGEI